jgi:tRNA uridine 5-carboxymethylaminomethyl modification enzyme
MRGIPDMSDYDVIVVGGGHAGCEAAHAAARLGLRVALVTMRLEAIARMSCNPSIGGPAKGHLTREIDALGGLQGAVTDATYVNLRLLNTGKGASVQALRAQSDRQAYSREMRRRLAATPGLELVEGEAGEILVGAKPCFARSSDDRDEQARPFPDEDNGCGAHAAQDGRSMASPLLPSPLPLPLPASAGLPGARCRRGR